MSIRVPNGLNAALMLRTPGVALVQPGAGVTPGPGIVTRPVISGDNYAGQTLVIDTAAVWDGTELSNGRNWQENGIDIPGATGTTYEVPV